MSEDYERERLISTGAQFVGSSVHAASDATFHRIMRVKDPLLSQRKHKEEGSRLRGQLSLFQLLGAATGMTIGAGIYTIVGSAAHEAGPSLVVSLAGTCVAAMLVALCYGELASMYPVAGSAYSFAFFHFGEVAAHLVGWSLILEYGVSAAVVAASWGHYLATLLLSLGVSYPKALYDISISAVFDVNITAAVVLVLLTVLLAAGLQRSMGVNTAVVVVNVATLVFFMIYGAFNFHSEYYSPFWANGFQGTLKGAAMMFFAYLGFDGVTALAEEAARPRRDIPRAIMWNLALCGSLYVGVAAVLVGAQRSVTISATAPLAEAFDNRIVKVVVALSAVTGLGSTILGCLLGQCRIWFAMARDGLISRGFADVTQEGSPGSAVWLAGIPAAAVALMFRIPELANVTSLGASFAFILVCSAVLQHRYREKHGEAGVFFRILGYVVVSAALSISTYLWIPERTGPSLVLGAITIVMVALWLTMEQGTLDADPEIFRVPMVPVVPLLGISVTLHIMIGQGWVALGFWFCWTLVGGLVYALWGYSHSEYLHSAS